MLRIVMSSIKRCRSAEICWDIEYSCLLNCTKRAIFSDRMFDGHGHFPIISHSQGSENRYCTNPLRGRKSADREVPSFLKEPLLNVAARVRADQTPGVSLDSVSYTHLT